MPLGSQIMNVGSHPLWSHTQKSQNVSLYAISCSCSLHTHKKIFLFLIRYLQGTL